MILRARHLVPVSHPPVEDGALEIHGDRIVRAGRWADIRSGSKDVVDLGEVILLPGLVNAHAHFDYTDLAGQLSPPRSFPDWIKSILAAKAQWTDDDFATSWKSGAHQSLASGTTTVANIETLPHRVAALRESSPLRIHSFLEMTGVRARREPSELVASAIEALQGWNVTRGGAGLSPHAPYSTQPELLRQAAEAARHHRLRLTTHLAESREEFEMFMYRRGAMHEWLRGQRPDDDCGLGSPVRHAALHGLLGPDFISVHVNHLWNDDAPLLGNSGSHVVHCPRSHAYFKHQRFPADELLQAGVNLCLGTDSLASVRIKPGGSPQLSMFDEMAAHAACDATISPAEILTRATRNGAIALGLQGHIGVLAAGALADFCVIPDRSSGRDLMESIVHHPGKVRATWIGGSPVWEAEPTPATTAV